MVTEYLSMQDVADLAGIPVETVRTLRHRGKLPPPDVMVGERTPGWRQSTVDKWLAKRNQAEGTKS